MIRHRDESSPEGWADAWWCVAALTTFILIYLIILPLIAG